MFITFICREPCLKTFKQALVFFLCQKTGRFLLIFHTYFSRFHKMKSRTYFKILRNSSLQMNVLCRYVKFQAWGMINEGDILVQKVKVKKIYFHIPGSLISLSVYQCLHK